MILSHQMSIEMRPSQKSMFAPYGAIEIPVSLNWYLMQVVDKNTFLITDIATLRFSHPWHTRGIKVNNEYPPPHVK